MRFLCRNGQIKRLQIYLVPMRKENFLYSILTICLFAFCSCSTDTASNVKLLKKTISTSETGTSVTTVFTYVADEIGSIDDANTHVDFTYSDGLIVKKVTTDKESSLVETIEYTYNAGELIRAESLNKYKINYIYNSDNTISYQKMKIVSEDQEIKEFHGILFFENENLIKDERILDNTATGTVSKYNLNFDYDSKKNPLFNIVGYKKLLDCNQAISTNNSLIITENTSIDKDDQIISSAKMYKNSFTYDSDGYPKEQACEPTIFNSGYVKIQYFY